MKGSERRAMGESSTQFVAAVYVEFSAYPELFSVQLVNAVPALGVDYPTRYGVCMLAEPLSRCVSCVSIPFIQASGAGGGGRS